MKAACPCCGAGGSVELFIADAEWRKAIMAAAQLPSDCGTPAVCYVGMFRPPKRFLTPGRAALLLREVCDMIINGAERNRQAVEAPAYIWRQALLEMHDNSKITRPLKSHGYLLEVVQSKLAQRDDVNQSERTANRRNAEPSRTRTTLMQVGAGPRARPVSVNNQGRPQGAAPTSALPNIPDGKKGLWMKKATADLLDKGMKEQFIIAPLVEQRAKEMYADSQS